MPDLNEIFKAYDVRGVVPDELDESVAEAVGAAFVRLTGAQTLVTLHDMRPSSETIFGCRPFSRQESGDERHHPRERHAGVRPFLEQRKPRDQQDDRGNRFHDSKNNPEMLRVAGGTDAARTALTRIAAERTAVAARRWLRRGAVASRARTLALPARSHSRRAPGSTSI